MIALRPAVAADAPTLGALFTASRRLLTFLPALHSPQDDMAFIAGHILPGFEVTVAEDEGQIAGYMAEAPGWIEQLYLHPTQLRRGIGSALLRSAQVRQPALELWCFAQNMRGRAFYERHGFQMVDQTDGSGNAEGAADLRYRWEADHSS
jgi:GNAT superfamily N-acetyltransferase